jgi:hypothetical protein
MGEVKLPNLDTLLGGAAVPEWARVQWRLRAAYGDDLDAVTALGAVARLCEGGPMLSERVQAALVAAVPAHAIPRLAHLAQERAEIACGIAELIDEHALETDHEEFAHLVEGLREVREDSESACMALHLLRRGADATRLARTLAKTDAIVRAHRALIESAMRPMPAEHGLAGQFAALARVSPRQWWAGCLAAAA